ncbi:MAG: glycosyltransferase family 39 protein, partial [Chloroflexota bacterium]
MGRFEVVAWVVVAAVALGIRLINLDGAPLQPGESVLALDSWQILHHAGIQIASAPLLIYLNTLLFLILGSSDAVARALPCLVGVAVALSPILVRHHLGRTGALVAATVLATSPTLIFASRTVDPTIVTIGLGLGLVLAAERYSRRRRQAYLIAGAVLVGLLLVSGPLAYDLVIILVSFVAVYGSEDLRSAWVSARAEPGALEGNAEWANDVAAEEAGARSSPSLSRIFILLAATVVLVGTALGTNLEGMGLSLSAPLGAWAAALSGIDSHRAWLFPALLVGYEPAALL